MASTEEDEIAWIGTDTVIQDAYDGCINVT